MLAGAAESPTAVIKHGRLGHAEEFRDARGQCRANFLRSQSQSRLVLRRTKTPSGKEHLEIVEDSGGLDAEAFLDLARIPSGALQRIGQRTFLARVEGEAVAFRRGGYAALAARFGVFQRGQHAVPDRTVKLLLGAVEFLRLEAFHHADHVGETLRAFQIAAQPIERVGHATGHSRGRRQICHALRHRNAVIAGCGIGQHPRVLAPPAQFGSGETIVLDGHAGQRAGQNFITTRGVAQREENVILPPLIERSAAVERNGQRTGCARLRDKILRFLRQQKAQLLDVCGRGRGMVEQCFAVERTHVEIIEPIQHVIALVEVTEPPCGQGRKNFRLPEVKADDAGAEREDGAVVGQAAADGVDQRHFTAAHALHETGDAEQGVALEDHRIEPGIPESHIKHMNAFEAGDRLEIKFVVEHKEVTPLDQRDTGAAGKKAVLGISRGRRAAGEQGDDRIVDALGSKSAECFEQTGRRVGNAPHMVAVKNFRINAGERTAVLHHVGNARGLAEVMVRHRHAAVGQAGESRASQMEKSTTRQGKTDGRTLEERTTQHRTGRKDMLTEDFFRTVDILEEKLEGAQALIQSRGQVRPFRRSENSGQRVAEPRALSPRAVAIDVEGDAHLPHRRLETLDDQTLFRPGRGQHLAQDRTVEFARFPVRVENLMPQSRRPVFAPVLHLTTVPAAPEGVKQIRKWL